MKHRHDPPCFHDLFPSSASPEVWLIQDDDRAVEGKLSIVPGAEGLKKLLADGFRLQRSFSHRRLPAVKDAGHDA
jgi:hypothetical protein